MTGISVLLSPPLAFFVFLAAALGLYALAKVQFGYRLFFFIALFFTMMHVAVLVIATVPSGKIVFFALFYLVMIALAVSSLITRS